MESSSPCVCTHMISARYHAVPGMTSIFDMELGFREHRALTQARTGQPRAHQNTYTKLPHGGPDSNPQAQLYQALLV